MPTLRCMRACLQVRLATFSQHHVDGLDLALTPLQVSALRRVAPQTAPQTAPFIT